MCGLTKTLCVRTVQLWLLCPTYLPTLALADAGSMALIGENGCRSMLHALRHRNIVQFYGACLEPDCLAIVTELMNASTIWLCLASLS